MKVKMPHNYIPFAQSLSNFSISLLGRDKGAAVFNEIRCHGFAFIYKRHYPLEHQKLASLAVHLYYAYFCILVSSQVNIKRAYFNELGEWVYENMDYVSVHEHAENIFKHSGGFSQKKDGEQEKFYDFLVEDVDFEKLLKNRAQETLEGKPPSIYKDSMGYKNLERIRSFLKENLVSFETREQFYQRVLEKVLPEEFASYKKHDKEKPFKSSKFIGYWEFFKPEEFYDVEEDH